jgi:hypothetical protein
MKTYKKNYIGKGKKVATLDIIKITCKLEDLQNFAYCYKDGVEEYVTFEVAKMKKPDNFGRDYTVYVTTEEEAEEEKEEEAPKKGKDKAPAAKTGKPAPKEKAKSTR